MSIVFGWYSFKLKSYTAKDLNIPSENMEGITFEVREKSAHLMWIPVFSMGKMYALRKQGQLYNLPDDITTLIKKKGKVDTPWYSFSLPILIILGLLIAGINVQYKKYKHYQYEKDEFEFTANQSDRELKHLTTDHYLKIRSINNWDNTDGLFLKVEKIEKGVAEVAVLNTGLIYYKSFPFAVKNFYLTNHDKLKTVKIPLSKLKKSICRDFETFDSKIEFGQPLLGDNINYMIESVVYNQGPVIIDRRTGSYVHMQLHNFGTPVKLIQIKNIENNVKWENDLPMDIPTDTTDYDYFNLAGDNYTSDTKYKFMLVFRDTLKKQYKYIIEGTNFDRRVERVIE